MKPTHPIFSIFLFSFYQDFGYALRSLLSHSSSTINEDESSHKIETEIEKESQNRFDKDYLLYNVSYNGTLAAPISILKLYDDMGELLHTLRESPSFFCLNEDMDFILFQFCESKKNNSEIPEYCSMEEIDDGYFYANHIEMVILTGYSSRQELSTNANRLAKLDFQAMSGYQAESCIDGVSYERDGNSFFFLFLCYQ